MKKNPSSVEKRSTFVQNAVTFIDRSNLAMTQLRDYQHNLNDQVKDMVGKINQIGNDINKLNDEIGFYEASGDHANDLRDRRNVLLDELSSYVSITYKEDTSNRVQVSIEGVPFVSDGKVYNIKLERTTNDSLFLKPVWEQINEDVFDFSKPVVASNNNDYGALKALLLARGTSMTNYTNFDSTNYEQDIEPSILMKTMTQFDVLVHGVVTLINDTVSPVDVTTGELAADAPYGLDGSQYGEEIFKRVSYDRFDSNGEYIEEDSSNYFTLYTAGNLEVNKEILMDFDKISVFTEPGALSDSEVVGSIIEAWGQDFSSLKPDSLVKYNYNEYYAGFITEMSNVGYTANVMVENQQFMTNQIDNQRMAIMAVSSDEELGKMIQYQYAYSASSRVVTIVDEMLERIVTSLGVVGR